MANIYNLSRNLNAMRHMLGGGFWIGETHYAGKNKKRVLLGKNVGQYVEPKPSEVEVTQGLVDSIRAEVEKMPKLKAVADALFDRANTIQKQLVDERSVQMDGYPKAIEENYWALRVKEHDLPPRDIKEDTKGVRDFIRSVEGGWLIPRLPGAASPIILDDLFYSAQRSSHQVNAYNAFADALRFAKQIVNDPVFAEAVSKRYSASDYRSFQNYIRSIEGSVGPSTELDSLIPTLMSKIHMRNLVFGWTVYARQPFAVVAAYPEFNVRDFRAGLASAPTRRSVISQHSGILRNRFLGNAMPEMHESVRGLDVMRTATNKQGMQGAFKGIAFMDAVAVGYVWNMAEAEINRTRPELTGDEKMEAIARRTEEVVALSQQTAEKGEQSLILQEKGGFETYYKFLAAYMSQPNRMYRQSIRFNIERKNALRDMKLAADAGDDEARRKAKQMMIAATMRLLKSIVSNTVNAIAMQSITELSWKLRNKTPDKLHPALRWLIGVFGQGLGLSYGGNIFGQGITSSLIFRGNVLDPDFFTGNLMTDAIKRFTMGAADFLALVNKAAQSSEPVFDKDTGEWTTKFKKDLQKKYPRVLDTALFGIGVNFSAIKETLWDVPKNIYEKIVDKDTRDEVDDIAKYL